MVTVGKHLPVVQSFAVIGDVEAIDGRGRSEIVLAWEVVDSRVGDVNILEVGRNLDTVGRRESVGNRLDNTSIWLESIHLRLDGRCRPEILPIPIWDICEPEVSGDRVLLDVVQRREISSQEIVDEDFGAVRRGVHEHQLGWVRQIAFVTKHDLLASRAVRWCADRVECGSTIGLVEIRIPDRGDRVVVVDVDRRYVDGVIEAAIPVGCSIKLAGLDIVYSSFVESYPICMRDELLRYVRPKDVSDLPTWLDAFRSC